MGRKIMNNTKNLQLDARKARILANKKHSCGIC